MCAVCARPLPAPLAATAPDTLDPNAHRALHPLSKVYITWLCLVEGPCWGSEQGENKQKDGSKKPDRAPLPRLLPRCRRRAALQRGAAATHMRPWWRRTMPVMKAGMLRIWGLMGVVGCVFDCAANKKSA